MEYIEECMSLDIVPLDEAGGIVSWFKRTYTGKDDELIKALNLQLIHIKTPEQKAAAQKEIAAFITKAEEHRDASGNDDFLWTGVIGAKYRGENRKSGALAGYVASLRKVEARINQIKV